MSYTLAMEMTTPEVAAQLGLSRQAVSRLCMRYWELVQSRGEPAARALAEAHHNLLPCRRIGQQYVIRSEDVGYYQRNAVGKGWAAGTPRPPEKRRKKKGTTDADHH